MECSAMSAALPLWFNFCFWVKTTIDIPDEALADAMRFTGAKTKREAVVKALEAYNRQQRVNDLIASFGTLDFASNDEIEAGDLEGFGTGKSG